MKDYTINIAQESDLVRIVEIYNQAIRAKDNAIIDEIEVEIYKEDFRNRDLAEYPIYTFQTAEKLVGWISLSPYRSDRVAYKSLKEVSFYIDYQHLGKGIGSKMLEFIISNKDKLNYKSLIAILISSNKKSISLLKKYDFEEWGVFPKVLEMQPELESVTIFGRNFK